MRNRILAIGVALYSTWTVTGRAEDKIALPDEIGLTPSIEMTDRDELYLVETPAFFKFRDAKELTLATELTYGFTDDWEAGVELPFIFRNPATGRTVSGIGDVEVGTRYRLLDFDQPVALVAGLGLSLPTGSRPKDLGEGRVAIEPSLEVSRWFGKLNAMVSFAWRRAVSNAGDEPRDEFEYNVALVYPVGEFFVALEGNGESNTDATKYYVTPGLVWAPKGHFQCHINAPIGVTQAAADYGILGGVTVSFDDVFDRGH